MRECGSEGVRECGSGSEGVRECGSESEGMKAKGRDVGMRKR